ncbi:MAG: hypothetical protein HY925_05155 [Elusimicrobia bacterium]|nr:hypothetical protein [Elusimicrobiota bacterium]
MKLLLLALLSYAAVSSDAAELARIDKEAETINWTITAASRCPSVDKENRWLDGTCVQLVTKTAGGLMQLFVPESREVVKGLLEIIRCQRGPKVAGGTLPYLAPCVERKAQEATRALTKWKSLRVKSPDLPGSVPDAPLPQGDVLFH